MSKNNLSFNIGMRLLNIGEEYIPVFPDIKSIVDEPTSFYYSNDKHECFMQILNSLATDMTKNYLRGEIKA